MKCMVAVRLLLLVLAFFSVNHSIAASFSCDGELRPVEKLICSDSEVGELDKEMARLYFGNQKYIIREELSDYRDEQREYLRERNGYCLDVACLASSYKKRISQLKNDQIRLLSRYENSRSKNAICTDFQDLLNGDGIKEYFVTDGDDIAKTDAYREFEESYAQLKFAKRVDLNGDGALEGFVIATIGTASSDYTQYYDAEFKEKIDFKSGSLTLSEYLYPYFDGGASVGDKINLVKYKGRYFVVVGTHNRVWSITGFEGPDYDAAYCLFNQSVGVSDQPSLSLNNNPKLCDAIEDNQFRYSAFSYGHNVTRERLEEYSRTIKEHRGPHGIAHSFPSKGAAYVDIDNDGSKEYVLKLNLESSAGAGCSSNSLVVISDDRSKIVSSPLNESIGSFLGCDGSELKPIEIGREFYLARTQSSRKSGRVSEAYEVLEGRTKLSCLFSRKTLHLIVQTSI